MALNQALAFDVLATTMALFIWGRLRYDLVSVLALLAAVSTGIVPYSQAFAGFSDDIVIIVASALVVSAAVARSGVIEVALKKVAPQVTSVQGQIALLVATVTVLSAFIKNIGALAMMMPVALQVARRSKASPSCFLMPMAFGSLLGGLITLVGTSPNIIVSRVREQLTGQPFGMFDFAPVGLVLAAAGVVFVAFGYRLLPSGRKGSPSLTEGLVIPDYLIECRVTAGSSVVGRTVRDLIRLCDNEITVMGIISHKGGRTTPLPDAILREGDILLLEGEPEALERAVARARLKLEGEERSTWTKGLVHEIGGVEAVVGPASILVGQTAGRMALREGFNIHLVAVRRRGRRITERLHDIILQTGDVLLLKGDLAHLPEKLRELGCLPLAVRDIRLGNVRKRLVPMAILGGAMGLTAVGALPVAIAFFTARPC
jgi:di/tricarboxylate transporter